MAGEKSVRSPSAILAHSSAFSRSSTRVFSSFSCPLARTKQRSSVQRDLSCAERSLGRAGPDATAPAVARPRRSPQRAPGAVRCLAGPCRAAPGTCAARTPQRPSAQATQDPPAPTRVGGTEGAPAPAVPLLWPPSAGASAAPDHPLWGWPVQGQSERGEDRVARRKTGEHSRGRRAACRESAKRVVRRHDKGVGADGGGWRGACPSQPVERPAEAGWG